MHASRPIAIVAEDEPLLRMEAVDMLARFGFEVLEAEHAAGALGHFESTEGVVLLYTDIQMPGASDGYDLAHTVSSRWPDVSIIVCSGCEPSLAEDLPDGSHFIAKPCAETLVRKALAALAALALH